MRAQLRLLLTGVLLASCVDARRPRRDECPDGARCQAQRECPASARVAGAVGLRRCTMGHTEGVCCGPQPTATPTPTPAPTPTATSAPRATGSTQPTPATPSGRVCQEIRRNQTTRSRRALQKGFQTQMFFVIGGERAQMAEFPYMVAIGYAKENDKNNNSDIIWGCGGSLISQRFVLTAAHCITDAREQRLRPVVLRAGVNNLSEGPRTPDDYSVEAVTLHPRHRAPFKYHDLALLRTERVVALSAAVRLVCLPAPTQREGNDTRLFAAGWGATDPSGFGRSADLKKAELRFVNLNECKKLVVSTTDGIPRGVGDDMICASDPNGEADTCRGDSGGPLVARADGDDTLVGVTSFGGNPCAGRTPGVYARTAPALTWIESVVWP